MRITARHEILFKTMWKDTRYLLLHRNYSIKVIVDNHFDNQFLDKNLSIAKCSISLASFETDGDEVHNT